MSGRAVWSVDLEGGGEDEYCSFVCNILFGLWRDHCSQSDTPYEVFKDVAVRKIRNEPFKCNDSNVVPLVSQAIALVEQAVMEARSSIAEKTAKDVLEISDVECVRYLNQRMEDERSGLPWGKVLLIVAMLVALGFLKYIGDALLK